MPPLSFSDALRIAQGQRALRGPVGIATVIASKSPGVRVGSRAVFTPAGIIAGALGHDLDTLLPMDTSDLFASGRSSMRSYMLTASTADRSQIEMGSVDIFCEVIASAPRLIVVGAGHIAVPLVAMAKILEFEVTVVDDRPEYGNRERFPAADSILLGPYRETVARLHIDGNTFVVLVTRGHVHDQACLEVVLQSHAAYVGMIGSKRRVRTVARHAVESGASPDRVKGIHAPIGLDIGADTPAEIAVAIVAEMVSVRRGRVSRSLALGDRIGV